MASEFARRGAVVTGLDADPEMMAAAQRRIETESIQMLLIKGRAEKLPFNDGTFDRVLAVTVLYAFAKARERPVLCFAQVTNQMGRIEGDFEKGAADGAQESLRVISLAVSRWPAEKLS